MYTVTSSNIIAVGFPSVCYVILTIILRTPSGIMTNRLSFTTSPSRFHVIVGSGAPETRQDIVTFSITTRFVTVFGVSMNTGGSPAAMKKNIVLNNQLNFDTCAKIVWHIYKMFPNFDSTLKKIVSCFVLFCCCRRHYNCNACMPLLFTMSIAVAL